MENERRINLTLHTRTLAQGFRESRDTSARLELMISVIE